MRLALVGTKAAPLPLFRLGDKAGFDGIAMHIAQLLDAFCLGEYIEVVITGLPDELFLASAREALLDDLN